MFSSCRCSLYTGRAHRNFSIFPSALPSESWLPHDDRIIHELVVKQSAFELQGSYFSYHTNSASLYKSSLLDQNFLINLATFSITFDKAKLLRARRAVN